MRLGLILVLGGLATAQVVPLPDPPGVFTANNLKTINSNFAYLAAGGFTLGNHQVPVGNASGPATARTIPDCIDSGGNHLNFTQSTNLFSCGTSGGGGTVWGTITGTLSNQTDLQTALNAKQNSLGYTAENVANKNATNGYAGLSGGLLAATQLPFPGASTLGAILTKSCTAGQFLSSINSDGTSTCNTPSAGSVAWGSITGTLSAQTDLQSALNGKQASLGYTAENVANKGVANGYASLNSSALVPPAQLPFPGASSIGGVQSKDCSGSSQLVQKINTDGTVTCAPGSGSANIALLDCGLTRTSGTVLHVFDSASSTDYCSAGNNGTAFKFTSQTVITQSGSGNPTIRVYISDGSDGQTSGSLVVLNSAASGIALSGGTAVLVNNSSSFPVSCGIYIIGSWASTSPGAFDSTGTVQRPLMNAGCNIIPGNYMVVTPTIGGTTTGIDATKTTRSGATYLITGNAPLTAGAGVGVCDDGSGGITDSGCSAGGFTPAVFYAGIVCVDGTAYPNGWTRFSTNPATFFCPNSVDAYLGGVVAYSSAKTNIAVMPAVPVPTWWTSGTVTIYFRVFGDTGSSGNLQLQAATYCISTSTIAGNGTTQTYNSANATNTVTSATANHIYILSANLTMTGCSAGNILTVKVTQPAGDTWSGNTEIQAATVVFN